ncbi:putative carbonic anhydrase 3 [Argiope bruennichi]|uniref:putative carbonic anhydrase 3 n=1 Tax=Argiope bruennichi TaxID=94029 RepID=UPI00249527C7|nr:putative carbonic anhydrase 3 [Argiope bruennichi]
MNVSSSEMRIFMLFGVLFTFLEVTVTQFCEKNNDEAFSYRGSTNGPKMWKIFFTSCGGKQQSPIRIYEDEVLRDRNLTKLRFKNYNIPIQQAEIVNNGHTVMITPEDDVRRGISVQGSAFALEQFHFHWGSVERPGAEHTINHIRHPLEVHLVHKDKENRTAVVGLLVKVQKEYNAAFIPIIQVLMGVMYKDKSTQLMSPLNLNNLLPENPASFYRYIGSLTTPPCDEGVIWSILRKTTSIGRHQLDYFRRLYSVIKADKCSKCRLSENYRPSFPSREVFSSS